MYPNPHQSKVTFEREIGSTVVSDPGYWLGEKKHFETFDSESWMNR